MKASDRIEEIRKMLHDEDDIITAIILYLDEQAEGVRIDHVLKNL